ncbi:hypothetical protein ACR6C2_40230 [Streptomyces sp. INA 01156]
MSRGAEVVAVTRVADRQVDLSVRSRALGGRTVRSACSPPTAGIRTRDAGSTGRPSGCCTVAAATTPRGPR